MSVSHHSSTTHSLTTNRDDEEIEVSGRWLATVMDQFTTILLEDLDGESGAAAGAFRA